MVRVHFLILRLPSRDLIDLGVIFPKSIFKRFYRHYEVNKQFCDQMTLGNTG